MANNLYFVEFNDAITVFSKRIAHESLPTIDTCVAFDLVFTGFNVCASDDGVMDKIVMTCFDLAFGDQLVEHTAQETVEEDNIIRTLIFHALLEMGSAIHSKLIEIGLRINNKLCRIYQPLTYGTYLLTTE